MNCKVIIIAVNFHSENLIKILRKNLKNLEVIVINNNTKNLGFAAGVNIGVEKALALGAGRIFLVNPDVSITTDQIITLSKSSFDIVGPVLKFKRGGKIIQDFGGKVNFKLGRTWHLENKKHENIDYVSGACIGITAEVFKKIGLFDQKYFMYFEDADFCLRAKKVGLSMGINKSVTVEHDLETHKFSKNKKKMRFAWRSNKVFIEKWVPWYYKPLAFAYLFWLWNKISL